MNTTSNASNCGSCGAACEPGQPCTNGVCNGTADAGTNLDGGADAGWAPKGGYPDGSVAPTSSSVNVLSYNVVDAKFSNALGAIVAVSNTPNNALHIYTPSTQADEAVPLPIAPVAVALDPTGLFAAVAFDAHVAEIDLSATTIRTTCPLSSDAFDIVLAAGRKTYVVPATDQWVSLHAIDLATCTETTSGGYSIYAAEYMALHPSGAYVFAAEQDLEPSRINKCDVSSPTITCTDSEGMNDWGTYGFYGRVWTSSDGLRLYSGSGATLLVPGDPSSTLCSYGGTLAGASSGVTFLSEAPVAQKIAWIPLASTWSYDGDPNADLVVSINETQFLGSVATYQIPPFPLPAGQSAAAHGQFVFTTPGLDALYVIVQADQTSGALHNYAVATMTP